MAVYILSPLLLATNSCEFCLSDIIIASKYNKISNVELDANSKMNNPNTLPPFLAMSSSSAALTPPPPQAQRTLGHMDFTNPPSAPSVPPPPFAFESRKPKRAPSAHSDEDSANNVRWTTELVMILVRNCNQDRVMLQRLIKNEAGKMKHQGEVKESTIYQYINRIKRWAKGVYEADVRTNGIALRELHILGTGFNAGDDAAKAEFNAALKKEFKSMVFSPSQIIEIINLGRSLRSMTESSDRDSQGRTEGSFLVTDSKKKKARISSDNDYIDLVSAIPSQTVAPVTAPVNGTPAYSTVQMAVSTSASEAMQEFTKAALKQSQEATNAITSALEAFLKMQEQIEKRRLEHEEREREERRKERYEERKFLKQILVAKTKKSGGLSSDEE